MARKKAKETEMQAEAEVMTKPVRLDLDAELHRLLRKVAADEGVSMAAFARGVVDRVVRDEFKRRGLR